MIFQERKRPLHPGLLFRLKGKGSIGFFVEHEGDVYMITAAHLLGVDEWYRGSYANRGKVVYQTGYYPADRIGVVDRWIPIQLGVDGMAVKLDPWVGVTHRIPGLEGEFNKIIEPEKGMDVALVGCISGISYGKVTKVSDWTDVIDKNTGRQYRLTNLIEFSARGNAGDSGGLVVSLDPPGVLGVLVSGYYGSSPQWASKAADICARLGFGLDIKLAERGESVHIELQVGKKEYTVNGQGREMDVPAQIINGRTMVPLRFIAEALGAEVDWEPKDGKTEKVIITKRG